MNIMSFDLKMTEVYMVAGMALVTFGIRYVLFPIAGRFQFPKLLEQALQYVPPVVLTAIIVPSVLMPGGETLDLRWNNPYLIGAMAACLMGALFQNLLFTIVVSMMVFLGAQWGFALG